MRARVGLCFPGFPGGGIEAVNVMLAECLQEHLDCVLLPLLSLGSAPPVPPGVLLLDGMPSVTDYKQTRLLQQASSIARRIDASGVDLVLSCYPRVHLAVAVAAGRHRVPWVAVEHGDPKLYLGESRIRACIKRQAIRLALRRASARIAVSSFVAQRAAAEYGGAWRAIPNPFNHEDVLKRARSVASVLKSATSSPTLVAIGRLEKSKRLDVVLKAFAEIAKVREVNLIVVGDGPKRQCVESLAQQLGLGSSVAIAGHLDNPMPLLAGAAMLLSGSESEGHPVVINEAHALGVPVVSTNFPSASESVTDGVSGLLVPLGDSSALARAAIRLLDDPSLRERLILGGIARVGELSVERSGAGYLDVIDEVLIRTYGTAGLASASNRRSENEAETSGLA